MSQAIVRCGSLLSTSLISRSRSAFAPPCMRLVACRVRVQCWIPEIAPALSQPAVIMPRAFPSVTFSIAVMPAKIPLSSHLVDDCSEGSQSTGAAPRWISSHVITPVCIANVQPAVPWPSLTEPSEDMIAVWLAMAEVKRAAWSTVGHSVRPHILRKQGVGVNFLRGGGGSCASITLPTISHLSPSRTSAGLRYL